MALSLGASADKNFLVDSDDEDPYESLSRSLSSNIFGGFQKTQWKSSSKDDYCQHEKQKVDDDKPRKERDYLFKWAESDALRQRQKKLWDEYEANQIRSTAKDDFPPPPPKTGQKGVKKS